MNAKPDKVAREPAMRLALFEPEIPQNAGALIRLAACMGVAIDLIEPCGFPLSDRRLRRVGMDYLAHAEIVRHRSWGSFQEQLRDRLVLLTPYAERTYTEFAFAPKDTLMVGRESCGVPETVECAAAARVAVPMRPQLRSLNVAAAAAMVLGEALRQTGLLPRPEKDVAAPGGCRRGDD